MKKKEKKNEKVGNFSERDCVCVCVCVRERERERRNKQYITRVFCIEGMLERMIERKGGRDKRRKRGIEKEIIYRERERESEK